MTDIRNVQKEFLLQFIDIYKRNICLWNIKSTDYRNKLKRNKAYKELVEKLREIDPSSSKANVVKKIDSLRGGFRREWKKVENSKKSGARADDFYKPRLWYYDYLYFLKDQETSAKSHPNIDDEDETECDNGSVLSDISQSETPTQDQPIQASTSYSTDTSTYSNDGVKRARKRHRSTNVLYERLLAKIDKELVATQDEFDIIGKYIASKLRHLPKETRIMTEKIVMDIILQAELGNIDKTSMIKITQSDVSS